MIKASSLRYITGTLALLLVGSCIAGAQETKKPAAKPAAKAPAKAAAPAAKGGASAAGKGPTTSTAGKGPTTTTAGHGAATTTAGHGATTTAGRPAATTGARTAPAAGGARPAATAGAARPGGARAPAGSKTARAANGSSVRTRANGSRADVHDAKRGMDVHHGLNGSRRVSVEHADHSRVVAGRGGRGYVQRPYNYHGHEFAHRTYYEHGRAYDHFYRGYSYHGAYVEMYSPAAFYAPGFYGWAYNPWVAPVPFAWGFAATPWFGFYGGFFTPYPVYASPSLWLTDYMISQSLAAGYQAQQDAQGQGQGQDQGQDQGQADAAAAPLSPQVKDQIAAEVQRQIALENSEAQAANTGADQDPASSGIQRMLTDNVQHVFVVGGDLDLVDAAGNECAVSEGDALQLTGPAAADANAATLAVLASKGKKECPRGDTVSVAFADLQDMQNHMRETIDQGLGELQAKQGKGGLPALPASAAAPPKKAAFAMDAPPPDPTASTQINQSWGEADKAEQEVAGEVAPDGGGQNAAAAPAAPTVNVDLGQTIDQVTAALGPPKSMVNLGAKKIYVYPDMKITFKDGKVTDVQ